MHKLFIASAALLLTACTQPANTSNTTLNACLTQKAYGTLNDGTLFTTDIKTLATNISTTCLKQLALEKSGLNAESMTAAINVLASLKAAKSE